MSSHFIKNLVIDNSGKPGAAGDSKVAQELYCANCHGDVTLEEISLSLFGEQGIPTCRHCASSLLPMVPNQCLVCRSNLKRPHALVGIDGKPACATCKTPAILRNVPVVPMPEEPEAEVVAVAPAAVSTTRSGSQNLVPWLAAGIVGVIVAIGWMLGNILNPPATGYRGTARSSFVSEVDTASRPAPTPQPISITNQIQVPPQAEAPSTNPGAVEQPAPESPAQQSQPASEPTTSASDAAESTAAPTAVSNTQPASGSDGKSSADSYLEKGDPIK